MKFLMRRGLRIFSITLVIGLLVGLVIRLEEFLAHQLLGALGDEVKASIPCELKYDRASISLVALTGKAFNARVECSGEIYLKFDRIEADFSLKKIFSKTVELTSLRLIDGFSRGVGPKTHTFRFIEYLSEPIPPEKDRPGRWRIQLEGLTVTNSHFVEEFQRNMLAGSGVSIELSFNKNRDAIIEPKVQSLSYVFRGSRPSEMPLGEATSTVTIADTRNIFNSLTVGDGTNRSRLYGYSEDDKDDALTGKSTHELNLQYLGLPDWLKATMQGNSVVKGSLGSPILEGEMTNTTPSGIELGGERILTFDRLEGRFLVDIRHGTPLVKVSSLKGSSDNAGLELTAPLTIDDDKVSGAFNVTASTLSIGAMTVDDATAQIELSGTLDQLLTELKIDSKAVRLPFARIPNVKMQMSVKDGIGSFSASNATEDTKSKGTISFQGKDPIITANVTLEGAPLGYLEQSESPPDFLNSLTSYGSLDLKGPFDPQQMQVNGSLRVLRSERPEGHVLEGPLSLKQGILALPLKSKDRKTSLELNSNFNNQPASGDLEIAMNGSDVEDYFALVSCGRALGALKYRFLLDNPFRGEGNLTLNNFSVGCSPYSMTLPKGKTYEIRNGILSIPDFTLGLNEIFFRASGTLSKIDGAKLKVDGDIPLQGFISSFPSVDELSGVMTVKTSFDGPIGEPRFTGTAELKNGEISLESAGIDLSSVSGGLHLHGRTIELKGVKGIFNGGKIELNGPINLPSLTDSSLSIKVEDATFEPVDKFTITSNADLTFEVIDKPKIKGEILLQGAELERRIDLFSLIREASSIFFSPGQQSAAKSESSLPEVDLDVNVTGARNLFVLTNLFGAELRSQLHIGGSINAPSLTGSLDSLSGWFGLSNRRFDMTSGKIAFSEGLSMPNLAIIGEISVRSRLGDLVNVYAEANGPLTNPKVTFSSDSPLSQREILSLLTSTGPQVEATQVNTIGRDVEAESFSFFDAVPILSYSSFVRALTSLETLAVEPQYNLQSGIIEPVVTARKRVTDSFWLVGDSYLGSQNSETRLGVVYNLLPYLNLSGYLIGGSNNSQAALESNATLTILARQKKFVHFEVTGNNLYSKRRIFKAVRLRDDSRIKPEDMKRIRQSIRRFYKNRGYFSTRIHSTCKKFGSYCRDINLKISEGTRSFIGEVIVEGDNIFETIGALALKEISPSTPATTNLVRERKASLIKKLRSEGYISARVDVEYQSSDQEERKNLLWKINAGVPVTFIFQGNTVFSGEEFLERINLFGRRIPFGSNTIVILMERIREMYQEEGYADVQIDTGEREKEDKTRTIYELSIKEGQRSEVTKVTINGNRALSLDDIKRELGKDISKKFFSPGNMIGTKIEENKSLLQNIYRKIGFLEASIAAEVLDTDGESKEVVYTVTEGEKLPSFPVEIRNLPEDVKIDRKSGSLRADEVNVLTDSIINELAQTGYKHAEVNTAFSEQDKIFNISIDPGARARFGEVKISGLEEVPLSTVKANLTFKKGDTYEADAIVETRRRLFSLNLFSRVDVSEEEDPTDKSRVVKLEFTEKPLQTLDLGGGFNTEFGVHVFGEGSDRSLFKDGRSLTLRLDGYINSPTGETISKGIASLKYSDPSVIGDKYLLTEDLRYQKLSSNTQEFDLERTSLASNLYKIWENSFSLSLGHTILSEDLRNVSSDAILSKYDSGSVFLGFLSGVMHFDKRDNPLNPLSGYNLSSDVRVASPALGSEASYYGLGGKASWIVPFDIGASQFSIANALRLASSWTYAQTDYVPISQRYYLGGRTSVRGYGENTLGPRGALGSTIGGDSLLANNFELRYHPFENGSINLFFDFGNVFLRDLKPEASGTPKNIQEEDDALLRYSTGIGVRYLSPIGPIGLDLGFPINGREADDPWRIHFNIGTNF